MLLCSFWCKVVVHTPMFNWVCNAKGRLICHGNDNLICYGGSFAEYVDVSCAEHHRGCVLLYAAVGVFGLPLNFSEFPLHSDVELLLYVYGA